MADGGDGFEGRIEVVRRTRGYRRWPEEVKARIVAQSFQPGIRVVEVARHHGLAAHQLSDWRRQARQGLLALPADLLEGLSPPCDAPFEQAFVPLAMAASPSAPREATAAPATAKEARGVMTLEIGAAIVLRVPGDVPVDRAAALARALRGAA